MNTVKPYAKILYMDEEPLKKIEFCARISHRSEEQQGPDTWKRFIEAVVLQHGDWSVVEHASATVDMLVDRGITHEIVRHRLFSFTQQSTRFVNHAKKMPPEFVLPEDIQSGHEIDENSTLKGIWTDAIEQAEQSYLQLINAGAPPQIARSVFPNALASRILMTGNLRNWRHFLLARTSKQSHPQMREVTIPLLAEFQSRVPLLYDDIIPNQSQSEAFRKPR